MDFQNEEIDNGPLTKSKSKKEPTPPTPPVAPVAPIQEPTIKVKKPRPPKTEKQMEGLKKAQAVRRANLDKINYEKKLEHAKFLKEHEEKLKSNPELKIKKQKIVVQESSEEESESEPEIVYIKKHRKTKKDKIIIEESESESEEEPKQYVKPFGKSHQNKKSLVKTYEQPKPIKTQSNFRTMFTD
jgi:hypothetical protein